MAPDYTDHNAEGDRGPERVLRVAEQARTAFPDLTYDIEEVIAEGDIVAFRMVMEGTHLGPLPGTGLPGTGRQVRVQQLHMARIKDGKVAEHWAVRDDLGMLVQLGVLDPGRKPTVGDGAASAEGKDVS
jgi:predicted ester cyclase